MGKRTSYRGRCFWHNAFDTTDYPFFRIPEAQYEIWGEAGRETEVAEKVPLPVTEGDFDRLEKLYKDWYLVGNPFSLLGLFSPPQLSYRKHYLEGGYLFFQLRFLSLDSET